MESFIVVHAEQHTDGFLDHRLYHLIADEIGKRKEQQQAIYFLAMRAKRHDSELIYPAIRQHFPYMDFISCPNVETQFLQVKATILRDQIKPVTLAGVSIFSCVRDLYFLLAGKENPECPREAYHERARDLRWDDSRFEKIYAQRLEVRIAKELVD